VFPESTVCPVFLESTVCPVFPESTVCPVFPESTVCPVFPESTVCPVFPDFRKGIALFEVSYDLPAFPSHKSSVKMEVGMQYWWNDTDR
jgi:hypothetical protein